MIIKIEKGQKLVDALERVIEYMKYDLDDYGILQTDMSMYFNLCDKKRHPYPGNSDEMFVKRDGITDPKEAVMAEAKKKTMQRMKSVINDETAKKGNLEALMAEAVKRRDNAADNGFGTEGVWSDEVAGLKERIASAAESGSYHEKIAECLGKGLVSFSTCVVTGNTADRKYRTRIKEVYVRPLIDAGREVLDEPVYFYDGYFSPEALDDHEGYWYLAMEIA